MRRKVSEVMASLLILTAVFLSGCGNITVKRGAASSPKPETEFQTETGGEHPYPGWIPVPGIPVSEAAPGTGTEAAKEQEAIKTSEKTIEDILSMDPGQWKKIEIVNGNVPEFDTKNVKAGEWTEYTDLDNLGRSTCMTAVVHTVYPKAEVPCLTDFRPSGWHTVYYRIVRAKNGKKGTNLMRRCHLLKPKLGGSCEDARNFFAGTCALNFQPGMAEYEQQILDYLNKADGYVLYRVRPRFIGEDALCQGVEMEGYSLDDNGKSVCFHVFIRNIQKGIAINYEKGTSFLIRTPGTAEKNEPKGDEEPTAADSGDDSAVIN